MTNNYLVRRSWREAAAWHASGAWTEETLPGLLRAHARARPEATAVIESTRRLTWRQMSRAMERIAQRLASAGVDRGDPVIIQMPDSAAFIAASLAVHAVQGVTVPLPASAGQSEVAAILERVRARAFLGLQPERWASVVELYGDPAAPDVWADDGVEAVRGYAQDADALCEIMFTSGTTGRPKGAMNSANTKLAGLRGFLSELKPTASDIWAVASPMVHNAGWLYSYLPALLSGAASVIVSRGNPEEMLRILEREAVTIAFLVPTHAADLLAVWKREPERWQLRLRFVLTGAAASPPGQVAAIAEAWGCMPISMYGQTECQANLFSRPDDDVSVAANTVGRACPGAEVALRSPDTGELLVEGVGEVVTRGPLVFLGYFEDQAATLAAFSKDNWFRSGDLGQWDGQNMRIVGRIKEVINRGGAIVVPEDVERALDGCPGMTEAAVVGVPDARLGESVCVCVVGPATLESIREHLLRRGVGRGLSPDRVLEFDALPRTTLGKVQRLHLARLAAERLQREAE